MTLSSALLRRSLVTRGRLFPAHIRRMAISAVARLFVLLELFFDRRHLRIGRFLVVLVTSDARGDWNIGSQAPQRAGPRDIDVASSALHHVLALAAFVTEHCGNAFWRHLYHEGCEGFVTTTAVVAGGLLIFPMTVEARVMTMRHCLKKLIRLCRCVRL